MAIISFDLVSIGGVNGEISLYNLNDNKIF